MVCVNRRQNIWNSTWKASRSFIQWSFKCVLSSCFPHLFINSSTVKLCTQKSVIKNIFFDAFPFCADLFFLFSVKFVFFFLNFLVYLNFTIVARKWPQYVKHWERAEQKLLELHIMQQQNQQVQRKIWKIAIVIMFLALSKFSYDILYVVHKFMRVCLLPPFFAFMWLFFEKNVMQ